MNTTIRFHRYGGPEVLQVEDEPLAAPPAGHVLLRQHAIGVNYLDTLFRRGVFPVPLPAVAGVEGAGVIEQVGEGAGGFGPGDRVAYYLAPGSYRARRLIDAASLVRLPEDVAFEQAAALLTKGLTAWAAMHGYHQLRPGQTVLVQGASSAVGGLLARWAKHAGALVIGTAGSAAKRAALSGAIDHVLPSDAPDLANQVRRLAPDGVDVVYEFVGRATFAASVAAVRDGGVIANIGAASGAPGLDAALLAGRGISVTGGPMAQHLEGRRQEGVDAVFSAWRQGVFGPLQLSRYPLADAARAHADLESRSRTGISILLP